MIRLAAGPATTCGVVALWTARSAHPACAQPSPAFFVMGASVRRAAAKRINQPAAVEPRCVGRVDSPAHSDARLLAAATAIVCRMITGLSGPRSVAPIGRA